MWLSSLNRKCLAWSLRSAHMLRLRGAASPPAPRTQTWRSDHPRLRGLPSPLLLRSCVYFPLVLSSSLFVLASLSPALGVLSARPLLASSAPVCCPPAPPPATPPFLTCPRLCPGQTCCSDRRPVPGPPSLPPQTNSGFSSGPDSFFLTALFKDTIPTRFGYLLFFLLDRKLQRSLNTDGESGPFSRSSQPPSRHMVAGAQTDPVFVASTFFRSHQ